MRGVVVREHDGLERVPATRINTPGLKTRYAFYMTGQGHWHQWAWEGIGPPTWEPGPTNQNDIYPHNRALLYTEILFSSISCPGGWSQTIPQVKKVDVEVLAWRGYTWSAAVEVLGRPGYTWSVDVEVLGRPGYTWSAAVRPVGCMAKFSKMMFFSAVVEKLTLNYLATALVDIPAVIMSIAHSLKTIDIYGIVLCDKTAHFRVAFYCPRPKVHLFNDLAV
jgi:hypothetical protein